MLNFRKLKQDFSSSILKEGKDIHDLKKIISAKILKFDSDIIRVGAKILGNFENTYESEIEIDRFESQTVHSNCDCAYRYDCKHIAALVFYLEEHLDSLIVDFSERGRIEDNEDLLKEIDAVLEKEKIKKDVNYQKEVIDEYLNASYLLSCSSFFIHDKKNIITKAEPAIIINPKSINQKVIEFQLALRVPMRSKPIQIPFIRMFLDKLKYEEGIIFGGRNYFFSLNSFEGCGKKIMKEMINKVRDNEEKNDKNKKIGFIDNESFGDILSQIFESISGSRGFVSDKEDLPIMPYIFMGNLETPLQCSFSYLHFNFILEYIEPPASKILINPTIVIDQSSVSMEEAIILESNIPGVIYQDVYYRFLDYIKRVHIKSLDKLRELTIPEPLFGSFVENSIPELRRYGEITNEKILDRFVTIPYPENVKGRCKLSYVDGELEGSLYFKYEEIEVKSISNNLSFEEIHKFIGKEGILARNLEGERDIVERLFQDFVFNEENGFYITKSERKIVEFMTEIVPKYQDIITFEYPQNLLDKFVYDNTKFQLSLDYKNRVGYYQVLLGVQGDLKGVSLDRLWECVISNRCYIELKKDKTTKFSKILVLDLTRLKKIMQIFDEIGIKKLENGSFDRPLWSLVNIDESLFKNLDIKFSISKSLKEIQKEILGEKDFTPSLIPPFIDRELRLYQKEGVYWLERLRTMYLNGILADDMGLGKTVQAIAAITQIKNKKNNSHFLVICPTSLLHNWKEEFNKFNSFLNVKIVEGTPAQRKKIIDNFKDFDVFITSYTLMQKDVEYYKKINFEYAILDEAQHIKNRSTRNARSVKLVQSTYKMILTGTPIENSLEELWSLFDFLMPGFLSSFDRFIEKYVRTVGDNHKKNMEYLKKRVSPFILRRMKDDVLKELPKISEITYHCKLSDKQQTFYRSYAEAAKQKLSKLVEKEGFDKVQIHVLATLTRLKQICCHPAIFVKEKAELGDSAKYEMLLELLQTLVEGDHKIVIFSQYTQMLHIMKEDFENRGIKLCYLDGTTKNRLEIVKKFNMDKDISVFLVSLKAGGVGLNITGADTVIHYDLWWNPAVENQATDRVHRIGQKKAVLCYKLVTLNSIEEKIIELQKRKKGLVKKVVSCDDEVITKLTWEDVLKLLET
ncbi:MAG: helicase [Chlamydiae bacterium SM23_39]|nr:MAG: helicase [Chlamydiae bacterium SM23_39]